MSLNNYCLLTYTFDGDEAIVAPKSEVKKICESCDEFEDCEWENQDCIDKFLKAVNSISSLIEYVEAK